LIIRKKTSEFEPSDHPELLEREYKEFLLKKQMLLHSIEGPL